MSELEDFEMELVESLQIVVVDQDEEEGVEDIGPCFRATAIRDGRRVAALVPISSDLLSQAGESEVRDLAESIARTEMLELAS